MSIKAEAIIILIGVLFWAILWSRAEGFRIVLGILAFFIVALIIYNWIFFGDIFYWLKIFLDKRFKNNEKNIYYINNCNFFGIIFFNIFPFYRL